MIYKFFLFFVLCVFFHSGSGTFECTKSSQLCFCTETLVACSHGNFQRIPVISVFVTILKLEHNKIEEIRQADFSHLVLLQNLDLSHNKIRILKSLVFSGLGSLTILRLNHNHIEVIEKRAFRNLNGLRELDLSYNPIHIIHQDAFNELINLEKLFVLSNCETFSCERLKKSWNLSEKFCSKYNSLISKISTPIECNLIENEAFIKYSNIKNITNTNIRSKNIGSINIGSKNIQSTNNQSTSKESITIEINKKNDSSPIFIKTPDDFIRIISNTTLKLFCDANGFPEPQIEWIFKRIILNKTKELLIENIFNDLKVTCIAKNRAGIASKDVQIFVLEPKNINPEIRNLMKADFLENSTQQTQWSNNMTGFIDLYKLLIRTSDSGYDFKLNNLPIKSDWIVPGVDMIVSNYTGCIGGSQPHVLDCNSYKKFRPISGYCNNLNNPNWGSAPVPYRRILPAKYDDNFVKPIGWFNDQRYNGFKKPSARKISRELLSKKIVRFDKRHNHMLMQFGQFLDHDLTFAGLSRRWSFIEEFNVDCRTECKTNLEPCYSIERDNESRNAFDRCIEMIRSAEICGTGYSSAIVGKLFIREQANTLTSFIDGSQIYGSNDNLARYLRKESFGLLESSRVAEQTFLPLADDRYPMDCQLKPHSWFQLCFVAGDHRANEQIGLLVMHNIFLREHNRIAYKLFEIHPNWNDEILYQNARRIVGAKLQKITYEEWLPLIIGSEGMKMLGPYLGYNSSIDPTIANVFATVAMRFGHTLISPKLIEKRIHGQIANLRNIFFASELLFQPQLSEIILTGLMETPLKQADPSSPISYELTDHLFSKSRVRPLDLAAINIQRARDHGIPEYNDWRHFCGLKRAQNFDDLIEIHNISHRQKLKELYGHVDNIDPWVGAVMENVATNDAKIGPTFRCLLIEQFRRLRDGDRYFYMNENSFTYEERYELNKSSLAKIICDNESGISSISSDVFSYKKTKINCKKFENMNLNIFG